MHLYFFSKNDMQHTLSFHSADAATRVAEAWQQVHAQHFDLVVLGSTWPLLQVALAAQAAGKRCLVLLPRSPGADELPLVLLTPAQLPDHSRKALVHSVWTVPLPAVGPAHWARSLWQGAQQQRLAAHVPPVLRAHLPRPHTYKAWALYMRRLALTAAQELQAAGGLLLPIDQLPTPCLAANTWCLTHGERTYHLHSPWLLRAADTSASPHWHCAWRPQPSANPRPLYFADSGPVRQWWQASQGIFWQSTSAHAPVALEADLGLIETLRWLQPAQGLLHALHHGELHVAATPAQFPAIWAQLRQHLPWLPTQAPSLAQQAPDLSQALPDWLDEKYDEAKSTGIPYFNFRHIALKYGPQIDLITEQAYELHPHHSQWQTKWLQAELDYKFRHEGLLSLDDFWVEDFPQRSFSEEVKDWARKFYG